MNREETKIKVIRALEKELLEIKKKNKEEFKVRFMQNNFGPNGFYTKLNRGAVQR